MSEKEFKFAYEYEQKLRADINERWFKLHSYLNSLLGLEYLDECVTDDEELISKVSKKFSGSIYLVCEPHLVYGSRGELLSENTEQVLFCFSDKREADNKLSELNSTIEEEEGDTPYFIKAMPLGCVR
jgi:hypothetical protein